MKASPKAGYFVLEGINSFACAFFFNHFLFHLRDHHGFTQLHSLGMLAGFGILYAGTSVFAGRFAQRRGYFSSLTVGFAGLFLAVALAAVWTSLTGQLVSVALWSVVVCFTWPALEALCSEHESPERLPNRLGLYNVVWSLFQAAGVAGGGIAVTWLGPRALFWVPMAIHGFQLTQLRRLKRMRDQFLAEHPQNIRPEVAAGSVGAPHFQTLAWIANPLSYMAANSLTASLPALAMRLHLTQAEAGIWLGVWTWVRTVGFAALWRWTGWHYRFDLFMVGFIGVAVSFLTLMIAPSLAWVVAAQIVFGLGVALTYYSSLFYAMDGSDSHGEQGGTHEALIGLGLGGGPGLAALAVLSTGSANDGAIAVTAILGVGVGAVGWVHRRARNA